MDWNRISVDRGFLDWQEFKLKEGLRTLLFSKRCIQFAKITFHIMRRKEVQIMYMMITFAIAFAAVVAAMI